VVCSAADLSEVVMRSGRSVVFWALAAPGATVATNAASVANDKARRTMLDFDNISRDPPSI
jgi:hypothetical protein